MKRFIPILFFVVFFVAYPLAGVCKTAEDFDLVRLKTGALIEGCITSETSTTVTIETIGGAVTIPHRSIEKVVHAQAGESELLLGLHLLQRRKIKGAEKFLKKASIYPDWRHASQEALHELNKVKKEIQEKQKKQEQQRIEDIIRRKGLKAGIAELERSHQEEEYWGSMRGRLHLLMARDRIDHLDQRNAERHLLLAEKYGVNTKEWDRVRKELVAMQRKSILLGKQDRLTTPSGSDSSEKWEPSTFLATIQNAQKNGEKTPPVHLLHLVDRYSKVNQLDPLLVWAMIDTESAWQTDAVSSKGAQGLMQLMPLTAQELDVIDPFNPEQNIRGGTAYMRFLMAMFNDLDTALAAYNVGPGRVERRGIPPAGKRYIHKVRTRLATLQQQFGPSTSSS